MIVFICRKNLFVNFILFDEKKFADEVFQKLYACMDDKQVQQAILAKHVQSYEIDDSLKDAFINSLSKDYNVVEVDPQNRQTMEFSMKISHVATAKISIDVMPNHFIDPKKPLAKVIINRDNILQNPRPAPSIVMNQLGLSFDMKFKVSNVQSNVHVKTEKKPAIQSDVNSEKTK